MPKATTEASIACTRFAMGARPGDIQAATNSARDWLKSQMVSPEFDSSLPSSSQALSLHWNFRKRKKDIESKMQENPGMMSEEDFKNQLKTIRPQKYFSEYIFDGFMRSISAENSLAWRLLDFFSNHFSVSASNGLLTFVAPTLEREAIAPNLFGQYYDMLMAVEMHPAMIIYLNNERSFGPNSKLGSRSKKRGLNENLAREILELHSLGVNGGYQQEDVIELAKAISGWSITRKKENTQPQGFQFRENGHEPGKRKVLGNVYDELGVDQGKRILYDLSVHPATARFICTKLARHFIEDKPREQVIDRLSNVWVKTKGNLKEVITALIDSKEAWQAEQKKFKSPREFIISAARVAQPQKIRSNQVLQSFSELGQKPFSAGSPAGFGDITSSWDGADALHAKIEWSSQFAKLVRKDVILMATESLGALLGQNTLKLLRRAESQTQARVMLLMSPEFLRR